MLLLSIGVLLLHGMLVLSQTMPDRNPNSRYPFVTDMADDGTYVLRWGFNDTDIWFEAQAQTMGYVGFGISESGRMIPADVVVGWVANNQVYFADYHTVQYGHPLLDNKQDWMVDYGYEEQGWTVLGFHRRLNTCDSPDDQIINTDTQRLLYSYDAVDPADVNSLSHHDSKGTKSLSLLTMSPSPGTLPTDVATLEFRNENYTIPDNEMTSYHCRVFDLSAVNQKHHIIKLEPVYSTSTRHYVDHMILYRCRLQNPASIMSAGQSFNCFTDAPDHVQFCREHVASFGHGKEPLFFPEDVGIPIGGADEANVYVLATHYENEEYIPNLVDNSGIRVTYTAQLRPNDAAYLSMGNIISQNWLQYIPPGDANFRQNAYCSERCLGWGFRGSTSTVPMTVVGVQFHTHELGKEMKLRHMTRASETQYTENPWLAHDGKYDSQETTLRVLKERRNVAYYDHLKLECTYDSTVRFRQTVGGWSEYDELCRAYVLYYPRKPLEGCMSWSNYDQLLGDNGQPVNGNNVFGTLIRTNWTENAAMRSNLRTALDDSIENAQCWSSKQTPSYAIDWFNQRQTRVARPYPGPRQPVC